MSDVEPGEAPAIDAGAPAVEVGARVGELRRRGRSLSEMARRAGLGKATLSELEAGRRNPTPETLYAVTSAMGLPLRDASSPHLYATRDDPVEATLLIRYPV